MMKKLLSLLLVLTMVLTLFVGCGGSQSAAETTAEAPAESVASEPAPAEEPAPEVVEEPAPAEEPSAAEEASVAEEPVEEEVVYDSMADKYFAMSNDTTAYAKEVCDAVETNISYPLADGDVTLSMWRIFSAFIWNGLMESYSDMPTMHLIEDATGVKMEFVEVSDSAAWEQFNLTIASGDYTDLMSMDYYSGGVTSAYEEDIIIDLTDLVEENMPHYMAFVENVDDYTLKSLYTEEGQMLRVWTLASNVISEQGLSYRSDWAEEFGIESLTTIADLKEYLLAAKDKYNPTYPIFIDNSGVLEGFTGAFGVPGMNLGQTDLGMMIEDGKISSSLTDERFRNYITAFNEFYEAGLIKDNFFSEAYGPDYINSYIMDDNCAVSTIRSDKFTTLKENATSDTFVFEALAPLVENEGDTYKFRMKSALTGNGNMSVTSNCDDPELALQYMNWFYTFDGYMVTNYGEENVCFEYDADGNPIYTEFIVNNPDGYNTMNLRNMYTNPVFCNYANATAVFYTYGETELSAFEIWNSNGTDECSLPTLSLTTDESSEYSNIATTVYTYATETVLKWMTGETELTDESWATYVDQCNAMGVADAVEIYQGVYDRMYG